MLNQDQSNQYPQLSRTCLVRAGCWKPLLGVQLVRGVRGVHEHPVDPVGGLEGLVLAVVIGFERKSTLRPPLSYSPVADTPIVGVVAAGGSAGG